MTASKQLYKIPIWECAATRGSTSIEDDEGVDEVSISERNLTWSGTGKVNLFWDTGTLRRARVNSFVNLHSPI